MFRNSDYTTGNLWDYCLHPGYYNLIGINSLRKTNTTILQQTNVTGKLDKDDGATIFFITEK